MAVFGEPGVGGQFSSSSEISSTSSESLTMNTDRLCEEEKNRSLFVLTILERREGTSPFS